MSGSESDSLAEEAKALIRALGPVADELRQFGALVKQKGGIAPAIFFLISWYILGGIRSLLQVIVGSILSVFDLFVGALMVARLTLVGAFGGVGQEILGAYVTVQTVFAGLLAGAGPFAPVIAVGVAAVSLYVVIRVATVALGELPIGSSIVDLLGLR